MLRRLSILIAACLAAALAASAAAQDPAPLPKAPVPDAQVPPKATSQPAPAAPAAAAMARSRPAAVQPLPPERLAAFVDGWMTAAMDRDHVAGAAVAIVQNGEIVLKRGYGFADRASGRKVDPDRTLFRIASISKTFTWILVMREVEAGRMRLDQPINRYLPPKVRLRGDGMSRDVTVANLLDHSGGFDDRALGHLFEKDADNVRPLELYLRQERPQRIYEPGRFSTYSNYGAALAGEAVAHISGRTFERRVEEEITGPLGMAHTTFREPREERRGLPLAMPQRLRGDLANGYRWDGVGYETRPYEFIGQVAPAGAASSTAADMARYMLMMLGDGTWGGATVYGPRAARAFRTPLKAMPVGLNGWAHGLIVYDLPGGYRGYGHDGDTLSFHSRLVVIPRLNLGVFVTTSSDGGAVLRGKLVGDLLRAFYVGPGPFPRAGSRALVDAADRFEGFFLGTRRAHGGLEGFITRLGAGTRVSVTPDGRLITASLFDTRAWVPDGPLEQGRFVAVQGDAHLAFGMQDGRAASLYDPENGGVAKRGSFWMSPELLGALAALTFGCAVATLAGVVVRNRRDFRENPMQARAALVQNIQAGLWIAAFGLMGLFATNIGDFAKIMFDWPGIPLVTASACALVASILNLLTLVALPAVWRGGRRVDSWPPLRRAYFTLTVLVYAAFSILLFQWGGLAPWAA